MPDRSFWQQTAMCLGAVVMAAGLAAQELPRLPADLTLPQSGDSPGKVTFSHQVHLAVQARPDCTTCHPKLAPILAVKGRRRETITHEKMLKGRACGACHNGKAAHNFDDCSTCHR